MAEAGPQDGWLDGRGRKTEFVVWSGCGGGCRAADARMAANPHTFPSGAVVRCSLPPSVVVAVDEGGWPEKCARRAEK